METERVHQVLAPIAAAHGVDLYDVELAGATVRVLVDRPGGIDLDGLGPLTRAVSDALDELDPVDDGYTLEVSSPGLERRLRRPEHFRGAVGSEVVVRVGGAAAGERRLEGELVAADDDGVELRLADGTARRLAHHEIERARTVFVWGPVPKPGAPQRKKRAATS